MMYFYIMKLYDDEMENISNNEFYLSDAFLPLNLSKLEYSLDEDKDPQYTNISNWCKFSLFFPMSILDEGDTIHVDTMSIICVKY